MQHNITYEGYLPWPVQPSSDFLSPLFCVCLALFSEPSFAKSSSLNLDPQPKDEVAFVVHTQDKPMGSYVTMALDYAPFQKLKQDLEKKLGKKLQDRGEAHVTVISPVEFDSILKKFMKIEQVNSIALLNHIQHADLKYLCIGKGIKKKEDGKEMETYFVVVDSVKLREIRKKVSEEFVRAGGPESEFLHDLYFPHITLGFTERDLHYEDGVKKDQKSCFIDLKIKSQKPEPKPKTKK